MRKLFFTFCFIAVFSLYYSPSNSAVRSIGGIQGLEEIKKERERIKNEKPEKPRFESEDEMVEYIKERLEIAVITEIPPEENVDSTSISIIPSNEYIEQMKEEKKSYFQKVYENAIARVSSQTPEKHKDIIKEDVPVTNMEEQQEKWKQPDYPTVNVTFPGGKKVLVPAVEHIPYLMSSIEILPNGIAKVDEKIVVVANGEKLQNGLSKSLPRFSFSRSGEKTNLYVNIINVRLNGKIMDYKIEEFGNFLIFTPKEAYTLEPGVYTYEFEYIVDRQIVQYEGFREFFWNITGNNWNLIVARAGTILKTPGNKKDLGRSAFFVGKKGIDFSAARLVLAEDDTLAFVSNRPIFIGESMDVIVSMPNDAFMPADPDRKIYWAIDDFGDIILSLLGLLAIVGAYFVSWIFISDKKSSSKYTIQKSGPILRYLIKGTFDKISFGAFILELYRRNIIDIKADKLIKITDNLSSLSRNEKAAVNNMFINRESVLNMDKSNILKLNRAYKFVEQDCKDKIRRFLLKINSGYIIFSTTMLLLAQLGISLLGYSPLYNMTIMIISDLLIAAGVWLLIKKFRSNVRNICLKIFAMLLILLAFAFLISIVSTFSAITIIITIYAIYAYTNVFSNRNGLIKNNIKEAKSTRDYILKNIESICFPRTFVSHQPNIFALEMNDTFRDKMNDKDFYKLDLALEVIKKM